MWLLFIISEIMLLYHKVLEEVSVSVVVVSHFFFGRAIGRSRNPNFKVAITHVRQACSQHAFGLPLRMNGTKRALSSLDGIHRKKSDHFSSRNIITRVLILHDVKRKQNTALDKSSLKCSPPLRPPPPPPPTKRAKRRMFRSWSRGLGRVSNLS